MDIKEIKRKCPDMSQVYEMLFTEYVIAYIYIIVDAVVKIAK
jgi:hypothetical protein